MKVNPVVLLGIGLVASALLVASLGRRDPLSADVAALQAAAPATAGPAPSDGQTEHERGLSAAAPPDRPPARMPMHAFAPAAMLQANSPLVLLGELAPLGPREMQALLERFPRNQWLPPLGSSRNELEATRKARSTEQRTMAEIAARIRAGRAQADEIVRYFLYEQQLRQDRVELLAYALGLATGRPDSRAQIERELIMERARLAQLPNVERETLAWIEGLR